MIYSKRHKDFTIFLCLFLDTKGINEEISMSFGIVRLGKLARINEELLKGCEKLTFVYTETRYPDTGNREYTKQEAEEDIKIAEEIIKWVVERLS